MKQHSSSVLVAAAILAFLGARDTQAGIPIVWGNGEKFTDYGKLPAHVATDVKKELGHDVTVSFIHNHVHVFYCDLWTWNGRFVLRAGDKYWTLDEQAWVKLLGKLPQEKYAVPFFYRCPPVPAVLVVLFVLGVARKQFFKTDEEKVEALLKDQRYQRALDTVFDNPHEKQVVTVLDEEKMSAAVQTLVTEGIARDVADSNLRMLATGTVDATNQAVDESLHYAHDQDQDGHWDESVAAYEAVIEVLPDDDERKVYARNCVEEINEKRAAAGDEDQESNNEAATD